MVQALLWDRDPDVGAGFDSTINGHFYVWDLHPVGTQAVGETDDPIGFFITHEVTT